ncbi:DUF4351 domain-containing protein [Leptolyngbya sp. SLC-A1]|uniref:DUF4351 domain-containing protein n=1 Tax=Cyanophyceae TaxID=3028117 RepID=UPI0028C3C556|nr:MULTISPECIES: DUF4351 domain-containing protein [unclassified Phormidium]
MLPNVATGQAAQSLLRAVKPQGKEVFQQMLNLVEAILINKFPQLTAQEILAVLDIKTADIQPTRFHQEVLEEGRQEAEATLLVRFLTRRLGTLFEVQVAQIRALPLEQLDTLSEVLFDLANLGALET